MASAGPLLIDVQVSGHVVRPGDRLVVAVAGPLTPRAAEYLQAEITARLPGVDVLVIAANQLIVYRPDHG